MCSDNILHYNVVCCHYFLLCVRVIMLFTYALVAVCFILLFIYFVIVYPKVISIIKFEYITSANQMRVYCEVVTYERPEMGHGVTVKL